MPNTLPQPNKQQNLKKKKKFKKFKKTNDYFHSAVVTSPLVQYDDIFFHKTSSIGRPKQNLDN